ncbi:bifunctional 4-hydroxy-2-oxoglutarate aldolase/2-dehydro-3-deoxy-phosphogluconate aldolase [bacterium]|nr:bifunctional 4-hydroxy-2-oxoglutarate aldolase/2-dehydro-3-deoxy-phosphogluconate aldolase [bacterium]
MNIYKYIKDKKICAIVRVNSPEECLNISNALYDGGIRIIEIVLDPDMQPKVIAKLKEKKDLAIIAGGIITAREAIYLIDNGVFAISSPVLQTNLIRLCNSRGIKIFCTVSTANEAYEAWKCRSPIIKLHPTDALGGARYIKEIIKTMPFLNLVAAGGIKINEIEKYIKAGALGVCIGRDFYKDYNPIKDYDKIKNNAKKAIKIIDKIYS